MRIFGEVSVTPRYRVRSVLIGLRAQPNQSRDKVLCPCGAQEEGVEGANGRGPRTRAQKGQSQHSVNYYWALIRAAQLWISPRAV